MDVTLSDKPALLINGQEVIFPEYQANLTSGQTVLIGVGVVAAGVLIAIGLNFNNGHNFNKTLLHAIEIAGEWQLASVIEPLV